MRSLLRSLLAVLALAVAVVVAGPAPPAAACDCGWLPTAEALAAADAVFVATLVDVERPPFGEGSRSDDLATYTFAVTGVHKGEVAERQEIVSEVSGAACGLELRGRGPFLVFGTTRASAPEGGRSGPGQYYAGLCGGTRPLSLLEDIEVLGPARRPPPAEPAPPEPAGSGAPDRTTAIVVIAIVAVGGIGAAFTAIVRRQRTS